MVDTLSVGSRHISSLVAEIGDVIEKYLKTIGMLPNDGMDKQSRQVVAAGQEEMTLQQSN